MLKLERSKRALAVVLAVVMIAAAVVAGAGLFSTDKSKADVLGMTEFESIKLASASATASDTVFTDVVAEQNDVNKLTVSGKVDLAAYSGSIALRIGTDVLHSQIFSLTPDLMGEFSGTFALNATFCAEFENVIPVTISYGNDQELFVGNVGVVTYDYDSGVLGYPVGASYLAESGEQVALTKPYAPADAKKVDGKITVLHENKMFSFVPNPMPVADAPAKGNDGVYDQLGVDTDADGNVNYIKALLNTTAGREYAVSGLGTSVGEGYGISENAWMDADAAKEIINLVPGNKYSFWVRVAGVDGQLLPSAPVYLGSIIAMSSEDAEAKNAFLEKYDEIVVDGGKTLYPASRVTASSAEILNLITLYNKLPQYIKDLDEVAEKSEYLILSNFLAKHQDVMAAVKAAVKYDDLLGEGKFTFIQANAAAYDFSEIYTTLGGDLHLANETDAEFVIDLAMTYAKLYVILELDPTDAALDLRCEAIDYMFDMISNEVRSDVNATADIKYYDGAEYVYESCIIAANEYQFILFVKKHESVMDTDDIATVSTDALEAAFADLEEVQTFTPIGDAAKAGLAREMYIELVERYTALVDAIDAKNDANAIAVKDQAKADIDELLASSESVFERENPKKYYDAAVEAINARFAYLEGKATIEALRNGTTAVDDIVDEMLAEYAGSDGYEAMVYTGNLSYENYTQMIDMYVTMAKTYVEIQVTIDNAYADIDAMKNGAENVDGAADKYSAKLDNIDLDVFESIDDFKAGIAKIVADAKTETDLEKQRNASKVNLTAEVAALKTSGRYTADGQAQLDTKLAAAIAKIDALKFAEGKTASDVDVQVLAAIADFKTVNVYVVSFGNKGEELSGNVTNENGIVSSLTVTISKANDKTKLEGSKSSVVTGEFSKEKQAYVVDGKTVLLSIKLNPAGADATALNGNGEYVVKILLPKSLRGETGLQVVTEKGDTTYIYDTVRAGAYLVFTTTDLSAEFHIVGDKMVNLLWLVILLSVLLVAEIVVIIYFIMKKKKGVTASAFVPFFAALIVPTGISASIIALGALSVVGAVAATVLIIDSKKKRLM